jgi:hypothetical protein
MPWTGRSPLAKLHKATTNFAHEYTKKKTSPRNAAMTSRNNSKKRTPHQGAEISVDLTFLRVWEHCGLCNLTRPTHLPSIQAIHRKSKRLHRIQVAAAIVLNFFFREAMGVSLVHGMFGGGGFFFLRSFFFFLFGAHAPQTSRI